MRDLDASKAIGADGIPTKILKDFANELANPITAMFNCSIKTGKVPLDWKKANIIPIFKKGDKKAPNNYRPISLLPIISKVLERCIYNSIIPHIRPLITPDQYGFLENKSIDSQLLTLISELSPKFDRRIQTDMVYFDLAKAFDSVPHSLLIHKLRKFGLNGTLLDWFIDYLNNRYQRVLLEGEFSDWLPVKSGVPQGSILGPLEFIVFNNDLPEVVSTGTKLKIFADDTKVYRSIETIRDCLMLQHDINKIYAWGERNGLNFNINKCAIMTLDPIKPKFMFEYKLGNTVLKRVQEFVDLGILFSHNLNWKPHIKKTVDKAFRTLWLIIRTVGFDSAIKIKRTLYLTLVRSVIEFGSAIWNPIDTASIRLLESLQRKATNLITNNSPLLHRNYKNYKERLLECNLLPTTFRREIIDIMHFLRIQRGNTGFSCNNAFQFQTRGEGPVTRNQRRGTRIIVPATKYVNTSQLYPKRLSMTWNKLPNDLQNKLINATSINSAKHSLNRFYRNLLIETFDPNVPCTWLLCCRCPRCR